MSLLDFSLFAAFFPQLIAGPIVHFREVMPQLQTRRFARLIGRNLLVGLVIFAIGLFKKTVLADTLASYADPLFARATGHSLGPVTSWLAALAFTFQLYFDFSGYSDMAIGLGRMLGVKLPLNFHSPLRAESIIEFWRRWHMTLQRFIVAYIFQPLAIPLNRFAAEHDHGEQMQFILGIAIPTLVTFLAVVIWHGAGWTFVLFGLMHGVYLCVNELEEWGCGQATAAGGRPGRSARRPSGDFIAFHGLTLLAIIFANVMFRARTPALAVDIWTGMTGLAAGGPTDAASFSVGLGLCLLLSAALVFLTPNTQQIMGRFDPALNWKEWRDIARAPLAWTWRPSPAGVTFAAAALFMGVMFIQKGRAVFIYFNF